MHRTRSGGRRASPVPDAAVIALARGLRRLSGATAGSFARRPRPRDDGESGAIAAAPGP